MTRVRALAAVAIFAGCSLVGGASARAAGEEGAEALFREGKRAYEAGELDEACRLLARSDALDPTVGTLGLLAACQEKRGDLAAALASYAEVVARARRVGDPRGDFAARREAALEARVPRLVVEAPEGVEVQIAGEVFAGRGPEQPLRTNAGAVKVGARYADGTRWTGEVDAREGTATVVVIPEQAAAERSPASEVEPGAGADEEGEGLSPAVLATGGIGLLGLAVMSGFGIAAVAQNAESEELEASCDRGDQAACVDGEALRDGASTSAAVATVSFAVGSAGLVTSVVLWALTGSDASGSGSGTRLGPGPGTAGLGLLRSF